MYAWEGTAGADQLAPDIRGARELLGFAPTPLAVWARQALAPAEAAA
jgi:hypothetical protein